VEARQLCEESCWRQKDGEDTNNSGAKMVSWAMRHGDFTDTRSTLWKSNSVVIPTISWPKGSFRWHVRKKRQAIRRKKEPSDSHAQRRKSMFTCTDAIWAYQVQKHLIVEKKRIISPEQSRQVKQKEYGQTGGERRRDCTTEKFRFTARWSCVSWSTTSTVPFLFGSRVPW